MSCVFSPTPTAALSPTISKRRGDLLDRLAVTPLRRPVGSGKISAFFRTRRACQINSGAVSILMNSSNMACSARFMLLGVYLVLGVALKKFFNSAQVLFLSLFSVFLALDA